MAKRPRDRFPVFSMGLHAEDPEFGYRFLADELQHRGYQVSQRRVWRLCHVADIRSVITKARGSARRLVPQWVMILSNGNSLLQARTCCG